MTDEELTLQTLQTVPLEMGAALLRLTTARQRLAEAKDAAIVARQAFDVQGSAATMTAYANGWLTGKNQAERDVQLSVALSNDEEVKRAADTRREAELALIRAEQTAEASEGEVKALVYRLQAAQSAATLQAEMVRYRTMLGPQVAAERESRIRQEQRERALHPSLTPQERVDDGLYR